MFALVVAAVVAVAQTLSPADASAIGKKAIALLTQYAQEGDAEARAIVAAAWGQIGNPAAVPMLKSALKDKNVNVRIEAATSLQKLGEAVAAQEALEAIIVKGSSAAIEGLAPKQEMRRLARDKTRAKAVARLSEFGGEQAVALFERTLEDTSPDVREATALALARMGLAEFAAPFLQAAQSKDENVRAATARALGEIARPEYFEPVHELALDSSPIVRLAAVEALARFDTSSAAEPLTQALRDDDARVRAKALTGLSKLPHPPTRGLLRELLKQAKVPEAALKAEAGLALRGEPVDLGFADRTLRLKDADLKTLAIEVLKVSSGDEAALLLKRTMEEETDTRLRLWAATALVKKLQRRRS